MELVGLPHVLIANAVKASSCARAGPSQSLAAAFVFRFADRHVVRSIHLGDVSRGVTMFLRSKLAQVVVLAIVMAVLVAINPFGRNLAEPMTSGGFVALTPHNAY